jgi:thiol-disulfide isomerase/thioredoxin
MIRKSEKQLEHREADYKPAWAFIGRGLLLGRPMPQAGEPFARFSNVFIGYCDLHADGRYEMNPSLGDNSSFEIQPEELFCQLPRSTAAVDREWTYGTPASGSEFSLRAASGKGGRWKICGRRVEPQDVVYQVTRKLCYRFDDKLGLVDRINDDWRVDVSEYRRRAEVRLSEVKMHDAAWMAKFAAEADAYVAAFEKYYDLLEEAHVARSVADCMASLTNARELLTDGRAGAAHKEITEAYDAAIALHDRDFLSAMQSAGSREALYAQPPIDWETTDFGDMPHRSADYRGQVVVMDFWYRGCGHCINAMPKIKRLAAKYEGRPVTVLGMCNDKREEDAQSVIDLLDIQYAVLRCGDLVKHYGVQSWPTFVVLDQTGRVSLRAFGNSDNLEETLSDVVDDLLANPPE